MLWFLRYPSAHLDEICQHCWDKAPERLPDSWLPLQETRSVACQTGPNQRFVNISVLHYTYSSFMDADGHLVNADAARWQFNKRLFSEASPPVPFSMPPRGSPEGTRLVIQWMNEVGMSTEMWPWWGAHMHPHWPTAESTSAG